MVKEETYYQKLKQENQDLKSEMSWLDESFLLDPDVDVKRVYGYLKNNPSASKFIYKKYRDLRGSLTEICDPDNPLYLPEVAESLKETIQIQSVKLDILEMKSELNFLKSEKSKLQEEVDLKEREYDEIAERVESLQRRSEELDREIGNITDPEILIQVKSLCKDVNAFSQSVLKSGDINELTLKIRKLTTDQVQTLNLLGEKANNTLKTISDEEALSELKLSEKRQKFKEEIEKEKEIALNEMNAFMSHNPKKLLNKILNDIDVCMRKIEGAPNDGASGFYLNNLTAGMIRGNLEESMKLINHLLDQLENKERHEK